MKIVADDHIPYLHDYFPDAVTVPGRDLCAEHVKNADILLVRSITRVNEALLKHSSVRFVGSVTAGVDHIDTQWLKTAGIAFARADGFNAPPVADYVACVVAAMQNRGYLLSPQKKAAVIGVGRVGRLVVQHLTSLGFDVTMCDPLRAEMEPDFQSTPLENIQQMDLVTLHVPLTKAGDYPTHHLLDEHFFQRQQKDCVLINASRGAVIDTDVLLRMSASQPLCLDVYEHEPNIDARVLAKATIASPHIAGYSVQSKMRGIAMMHDALVKLQLLTPRSIPVLMPTQTLSFGSMQPSWQDVVLRVFDPVAMTMQLREKLAAANDKAAMFDVCRNQFANRYEFAFTTLPLTQVASSQQPVLKKLGFIF